MKSVKLFIIAAAAVLLASCGVLSNGNSNTAANNNASAGTSLGAALLGLYTQYKTDGKIDWNNLGNILNIATIANTLKNNKSALTENAFISDVISGSKNLVNNANASTVLNQLATLANVNLSQVTNTAKGFSQSAANTASASINTSSASITKATDILTGVFAAVAR